MKRNWALVLGLSVFFQSIIFQTTAALADEAADEACSKALTLTGSKYKYGPYINHLYTLKPSEGGEDVQVCLSNNGHYLMHMAFLFPDGRVYVSDPLTVDNRDLYFACRMDSEKGKPNKADRIEVYTSKEGKIEVIQIDGQTVKRYYGQQ